jgi:hypothetical protein
MSFSIIIKIFFRLHYIQKRRYFFSIKLHYFTRNKKNQNKKIIQKMVVKTRSNLLDASELLAVAKTNSKSTENVKKSKKPKNAKTINLITSADSVDLTKNVPQHDDDDDDESGDDVDDEDDYEEEEEEDTEEEEKKFEKN